MSSGPRLRIGVVHYSDYELDPRLQRQTRALAGEGHEVDAVGVGEPRALEVGDGTIRLHRVRCEKLRGGVGAYLRGYGCFLSRSLARLWRLDAERRFDLIEVHNMPDFLTLAALRPKLRGVPLVLDVMDTFPELFATKFGVSLSHPLGRALVLEERASAALADAVIVVTDEARERLNSRGTGVGRTHVVMNSPDERVFGEPRAPTELRAGEPLRAVYHGGTAERYGVESLVRGFAGLCEAHPDLTLDVFGLFGDSHVEELARRLAPERVRVAPEPVPFEEIPATLARFHVGVVPTLRDDFTELLLPVKLMEYVHMGMPVISSRLPVVERYFSDAEVLFYEPGSPEGLTKALRDLLDAPWQGCAGRASASVTWASSRDWRGPSGLGAVCVDPVARVGVEGVGAGPAGERVVAVAVVGVEAVGAGVAHEQVLGPAAALEGVVARSSEEHVAERVGVSEQRVVTGPAGDLLEVTLDLVAFSQAAVIGPAGADRHEHAAGSPGVERGVDPVAARHDVGSGV